jgi:hypothetical protein
MAAHESSRTTKLYDRTGDEITLDEVERITISRRRLQETNSRDENEAFRQGRSLRTVSLKTVVCERQNARKAAIKLKQC